MAVAPAGPGEPVARFQKLQIIVGLDPCVAVLAEHAAGFATGHVCKIEVKLVLRAIEHRGPDNAVAYPAKARDVHVLFVRQVDPLHRAAGGAHHAELDFRIRIAYLGIFFLINRGMLRDEVGNRVGGDFGFIHLQEYDLAGIGRPEIIAADIKLFGIDPVHFTVKKIVVAVCGERFFPAAINMLHYQVVLANIRNAFAVG